MGNLSTNFTHAPATADTAAVVTLASSAGGGPNIPLTVFEIEGGYDSAPADGSPGLLTVKDGENTVKSIPITGGGAFVFAFRNGLRATAGQALVVELSALSGKKGMINVSVA